MSISSEITRIQNKRDLSFQEIQNKGVTVPAGSTIDDLPGLIALIEGGGGTTITDGIVIKARDADGRITEVDYYGDILPTFVFGAGRGDKDFTWQALRIINFKNPDVYVTYENFFYCGLTELSTNAIKGRDPALTWVPTGFNSNRHSTENFRNLHYLITLSLPEFEGYFNHYEASECSNLENIYLPKVTQFASYGSNKRGCFANDTKLKNVQLGSVGYPVTFVDVHVFFNCTQTGLVIIIYTVASYVDTIVANTRYSATNATIIIKASETTTYNGTSYAAGDTILTSEVA